MPKRTKQEQLVVIDRGQLELAMRDVTPSELARRSGVLQQTIDLLIHGRQARCRASVRSKLARALGVHEEWLAGEMRYPVGDRWERWSPPIRTMWRKIWKAWTTKQSESGELRMFAEHVRPQHALIIEDLLDLYDLALKVDGGTAINKDWIQRFGGGVPLRLNEANKGFWQRRLWRTIGQIEGHVMFGSPMLLADKLGIPHPDDLRYVSRREE